MELDKDLSQQVWHTNGQPVALLGKNMWHCTAFREQQIILHDLTFSVLHIKTISEIEKCGFFDWFVRYTTTGFSVDINLLGITGRNGATPLPPQG
jgi:hypothetical protein